MNNGMTQSDRFAFGQNWKDYSAHCLSETAQNQADAHLRQLVKYHEPCHESFLDIGCGSGLFLLAAIRQGFQRIVGFDYDPNSVGASQRNLRCSGLEHANVSIVQGDVLDRQFLDSIGDFSFVYAWGSLHHTGQMWQAVRNAAARVSPGGTLVIAIYNRSITSPAWKRIKQTYVRAGPLVQRWMVRFFFVIAALAKLIYTGKNPFMKDRGMSFYYDIVDWVGGHPYEYASPAEVTHFVEQLGFGLVQLKRGKTPIACNEFVFKKTEASQHTVD